MRRVKKVQGGLHQCIYANRREGEDRSRKHGLLSRRNTKAAPSMAIAERPPGLHVRGAKQTTQPIEDATAAVRSKPQGGEEDDGGEPSVMCAGG